MRVLFSLPVALLLVHSALAQTKGAVIVPARYGVEGRLDIYPQESAKEALASLLSAIEKNRLNYALAHLVDPAWVDQRVRDTHQGDFEGLVAEVRQKLADDPNTVRALQRFLKQGQWESNDTGGATARVPALGDRVVQVKRVGNRWYFENRER